MRHTEAMALGCLDVLVRVYERESEVTKVKERYPIPLRNPPSFPQGMLHYENTMSSQG